MRPRRGSVFNKHMPAVTIPIARSALHDLETVRAWYVEEGVPDVGVRLVAEILRRIQALADHPDLGRVVPNSISPFYGNSSNRHLALCTGAIPSG